MFVQLRIEALSKISIQVSDDGYDTNTETLADNSVCNDSVCNEDTADVSHMHEVS